MRPLTKRSFLIDVHYTHVSCIFPFSKKSDIVTVHVNVKVGLERFESNIYGSSTSKLPPFFGFQTLSNNKTWRKGYMTEIITAIS